MEVTGIRYINLDQNWGRRALLELMLRRNRRAARRCRGVVYDSTRRQLDEHQSCGLAAYVKSLDARRINGIVGCWIAHSRVLQGVKDREGVTIVLEDDFVCHRGFFDKAVDMVREFDRDFDVIVFDPEGSGPLAEHRIDCGAYDPRGVSHPYYHGTHCLFVNNASIPRILETKASTSVMDFDGFLIRNESRLRTYLFYTGLSGQLYMGSDVDGSTYTASRVRLLQRWMSYYLS